MNRNLYIVLVISILALVYSTSSCDKHEIPIPGKVVDGGKVAFVQASQGSASIAFFANDEKISSSAALTAGTFGGSNSKGTRFPVSDYCIFPAGSNSFSTYILGRINVDSVLTSSVSGFNIENNKFYTYYYYDNHDGTQTASIIEDNLVTLDNSTAVVRFVNLVSNADDSVRLVVTASNEVPAQTLPYTLFEIQDFESVSATNHTYNFTGSTNSYTLTFRVDYIGTPGKTLVTKTNEVVTRGRIYTIVAFGSKDGTVGFLKFVNKAY